MMDTNPNPETFLSRRFYPLQPESALYLLILLAAATLRFWDLGTQAFQYDESLHALYAWYLFDGRGYQHNPMMHGPFQFHGTALVFLLSGASDYTARVLPALLGTALVGVPYFLRHQLGRGGALMVAALIAFSPSMLYYSRFVRNDIYIALWTLVLVVCLWRYMEERKHIYLYIGAAVLSLSFATKEVTFITLAIFGSFFFILSAKDLFRWLRRRLSLSDLAAPGVLFLLLFTLSLPQWSAGVGLFQDWLGVVLVTPEGAGGAAGAPSDSGLAVAGGIVVFLILLSAVIGLRWNLRVWLICAIIFYGIFILLYTTFFTHIAGFASGIWQSLGYWLAQQAVERGGQPWYYYLILLPLYEFTPLLLALAGAVYYAVRRDLFTSFLIYWAGASLLLYSVAGEKMPWLVLHLTLPLILLGGRFIGKLLEDRSWVVRAFTVAILIPLLLFSLRTAWQLSHVQGDRPVEMLTYAQGSSDVPKVIAEINRLAEETGEGKKLPLTVHQDIYWGLIWYLREYENIEYASLTDLQEAPRGSVLLISEGKEAVVEPFLYKYGPSLRFLYIWWPSERYKALTLSQFLKNIIDPQKWSQAWDYFVYRETESPYSHHRAIAYFPKDFELGEPFGLGGGAVKP